MSESIRLRLSPTVGAFVMSKAAEVAIVGPRKEGKSDGGISGIVQHALRQQANLRPIPCLLIRDTLQNLKNTTLKNFLEPREGSVGWALRPKLIVKDGGRILEYPGLFTLQCLGMDTPQDISQAQGGNYSVIWAEEVAPAAVEEIGGGLSEDAWTTCLTSLAYPGTHRAQISANYSSEQHWFYRRFVADADPDRVLFRIPRGENTHLQTGVRERMESALKDRPELADRLVYGRFATITPGVKVTPGYDDTQHVAAYRLAPIPGVQGLRFYDFGLTPVCLVCQVAPNGRVLAVDGWTTQHGGIEQLIDGFVRPGLAERWMGVTSWRDIGDPSGKIGAQHDSEQSAVRSLETMLGTTFEPGEISWPSRRDAVTRLMARPLIEGQPGFLVSPHLTGLRAALRGGWHYHRSASGMVSETPVKSHPDSDWGDALGYGMAKVLEWSGAPPIIPTYSARARAMSYNGR